MIYTAQRDGRIYPISEKTILTSLLEVTRNPDKASHNLALLQAGRTVRLDGWTFKPVSPETEIKP
jgi:hypothetical protein